MNERENIVNELKGEAPVLTGLKLRGSQPFKVPEGYFGELAGGLKKPPLVR